MDEKEFILDETEEESDPSCGSVSEASLSSSIIMTSQGDMNSSVDSDEEGFHHHRDPDEDDDEEEIGNLLLSKRATVCYKNDFGKSLGGVSFAGFSSYARENSIETASLTCTDSLNSSSNSSSSSSTPSKSTSADNIAAMLISTDESACTFASPEILRRRLHPLAPSPILDQSHLERDQRNDSTGSWVAYIGACDIAYEQGLQREAFNGSGNDKKKAPILSRLGLLLLQKHVKIPTLRWAFITFLIIAFTYKIIHPNQQRTPELPTTIPVRDIDTFPSNLDSQQKEWKAFFEQKAPKIRDRIQAKAASNMYTIRIRGTRLDMLLHSLDVYSKCPSVWEIQVDLHQQPLPDSIFRDALTDDVIVSSFKKPSTNGVFLADDDILLTCSDIERAFHEWKVDPSRMVGFLPFHNENGNLKRTNEEASSQLRLRKTTRGQGPYSILSDRAAFVHKLYLNSLQLMPPIQSQCQHLALSMLVSTIISKPPVAVQSNPQELRRNSHQQLIHDHRESAKSPDFIATDQASYDCQQWMDTVGIHDLPSEYTFYVGHQI